MRRLDPDPPEVRALVADRLQFVLGRADARRAHDPASEEADAATDVPPEHRLDAGPGLPAVRGFARAHVTVVAVLVLVGLLGAGWALFRARPVAVAAPGAAVTVSTAPADAGPSVSASGPAATQIVVHVVGAVRRPGLVRLPEGSRVQDAIDAADGLAPAAKLGRLNLAQVVSDGQQVVIGTARDPVTEVRDGSPPPGSSVNPGAVVTVDLNQATAVELEQLPGVGPVTAAAILAWRSQHGRFGAVDELQQVDGIGPKTYAQIAPHVRV